MYYNCIDSRSQWLRGLAQVFGRSPAEIMGSNLTGGMDILSFVSVVCFQVEISATN
jgi:hypothetical protein